MYLFENDYPVIRFHAIINKELMMIMLLKFLILKSHNHFNSSIFLTSMLFPFCSLQK